MKLEAIKEDGSAIKFIEELSEDLIFLALEKDPFSIRYIKTPSEGMLKFVIRKDWEVINYIENPSEEIKELAEIHKELQGWTI
jgi:hypothetical protein